MTDTPAAVTPDNKRLARYLAEIFGGQPTVTRRHDAGRRMQIDILSCLGTPQPGIVSYATIGLSDHRPAGQAAALELLGAAPAQDDEAFAAMLAACAFALIHDGLTVASGSIVPDVIGRHGLSATMAHVLLVPPFLWEDGPQTLRLSAKNVAFLLAVPIADSERQYAGENGADALENLFVGAQIDIFDLNRPPVT